ncbi:MAG TPA: SDR family oxidoreductase [Anaerolineae bacterium]|nr:SDR family oxidoreductase [Anaerolineae bacterium]
MRILLTGGAGFIGSHFSDRLLAEGHQVVVYDNLLTGSLDNIAHLLDRRDFTFIEHDVSESIPVEGQFKAVLHFASPASPNPNSPFGYPQLPIQTLKVGAMGTFNTLRIARAHEARFLLTSTSEVYGDPLEHPQREDYWGNVDPVGLRSVYDEAKRFAEAITMAHHRKHDLDTRIARIFNTYGPRMRLDDGRVVPNFLCQALTNQPLTIYGDGSQTRSFCFIDDMVEGLYRLLMAEGDVHLPVNIGNPVEVSIAALAEIVGQVSGQAIQTQTLPDQRGPSDPQRRRPDISRAKAWLDWEPKVTLETGLRLTMDDFKARL